MVLEMELKTPYMVLNMVSKKSQWSLIWYLRDHIWALIWFLRFRKIYKNTATKWRLFKSLKQMLNCLILYMVSRKELWSLICYLRHHIWNSIWFLRFGRNVKHCNQIKVFQSITFYAKNWQKESYNQIIPFLIFWSFCRKSVITKKNRSWYLTKKIFFNNSSFEETKGWKNKYQGDHLFSLLKKCIPHFNFNKKEAKFANSQSFQNFQGLAQT